MRVAYEFHWTMELWQDQFRKGRPRAGEMPTVEEYNQALRCGLLDAGHSRQQVDILMQEARRELQRFGYTSITKIRVPETGVYQGMKDLI